MKNPICTTLVNAYPSQTLSGQVTSQSPIQGPNSLLFSFEQSCPSFLHQPLRWGLPNVLTIFFFFKMRLLKTRPSPSISMCSAQALCAPRPQGSKCPTRASHTLHPQPHLFSPVYSAPAAFLCRHTKLPPAFAPPAPFSRNALPQMQQDCVLDSQVLPG